MSVVQDLQQNSPARTTFYIRLLRETSDAALAQALEQNPFVTEIILNFEGEQRAEWRSLLRVIATRAKLEKVNLQDAISAERRNASTGLVSTFLQAIQQNTAIQCVECEWLRLPNDFSTFVNTASSFTKFSLYNCDMDPAEREQGVRDLATVIQQNAGIETLQLGHLHDFYSVPMLDGLRSNTTVKTFILEGNLSDATSHALQQLLESTNSIQRFELHYNATFCERLFQPIAQAIACSESISELKFHWCLFNDADSISQLQCILQDKRNLTSLCLRHCHFDGGQVHRDIISAISRPGSLLQCFEFLSADSFHQLFPNIHFPTLLRAIEKSKLERLHLGVIQSQQQMQNLTQSIPLMKLTELSVRYDGGGWRNVKKELLQAVKNNFTLLSVKGEIGNERVNLFGSAEDKQTLVFYANRNERLDQWVDNPDSVDQKVWPEALGLAQRAGPDALFRGLRSTLGSDYVRLLGERKHKRPQFCAILRRLCIWRPRK